MCPHLGRYTVYDSLAETRKRRQQGNVGLEGEDPTQPAIKECPINAPYESLLIGCTGPQDTLEFKSSCSSTGLYSFLFVWNGNEFDNLWSS